MTARDPVLTSQQKTAFNKALQTGIHDKNMDMIRLALDSGADPVILLRAGINFKPTFRDSFNFADPDGIGLAWVKMAVEAGASASASWPDGDGDKWPALHWAEEKFREDVSSFLIEKGASVDTLCPYGNTPLMRAVMLGNEKLLRFYLEKGADPLVACGEKKDSFPLKELQESDKFRKGLKSELVMLMMKHAKKPAPEPEAQQDPTALAKDIEVSKPVELKHTKPPKQPKSFSI